MIHMNEKELQSMLHAEYANGLKHGIRLMEERLLLVCENETTIEVKGNPLRVFKSIPDSNRQQEEMVTCNFEALKHLFFENGLIFW